MVVLNKVNTREKRRPCRSLFYSWIPTWSLPGVWRQTSPRTCRPPSSPPPSQGVSNHQQFSSLDSLWYMFANIESLCCQITGNRIRFRWHFWDSLKKNEEIRSKVYENDCTSYMFNFFFVVQVIFLLSRKVMAISYFGKKKSAVKIKENLAILLSGIPASRGSLGSKDRQEYSTLPSQKDNYILYYYLYP